MVRVMIGTGSAGSRRRAIGALAVGGAIVLATLTGCAPIEPTVPDQVDPSPSATSFIGETVIAPVIVPVTRIGGTTVEVPRNTSLVLKDRSEAFTGWTASIADPQIVEFSPGTDDGSYQTNPGLIPLAEGRTNVTITNEKTKTTISFTVVVTPATTGR